MPRHYLRVTDISAKETKSVLNLSSQLKKELKAKGINQPLFKQKTLGMIFEKPSLRTRVSFEVGMTQLGGHAIYLGPSDIQMGKRESAYDIGKVTSSMTDMIKARVFRHQVIEELASGSSVPVINGLSDLEHPCQVLADYLTIKESLGRITNLKIAFCGDGNNNVTHSLMLMSAMFGNTFVCASPTGYEMAKTMVKEGKSFARITGGKIIETTNPASAVKDADVIITDTWISMGDEKEAKKRLKVFPPYQVTSRLMQKAKPKAIFMHCLPAYRGKEVESAVIDGPQSVVYQEAENRLHAQKGLMVWLLKNSH